MLGPDLVQNLQGLFFCDTDIDLWNNSENVFENCGAIGPYLTYHIIWQILGEENA